VTALTAASIPRTISFSEPQAESTRSPSYPSSFLFPHVFFLSKDATPIPVDLLYPRTAPCLLSHRSPVTGHPLIRL
jgi:hypothetical protein